MSTLPVPGGILAMMPQLAGQISPAMMAAAALRGGDGPQAPGAPIGAVQAPQAPTLATNAAPMVEQAPVNLGQPDALPAVPGVDIHDAVAELPQGNIPQHRGILGTIGDGLRDPNVKAALMRAAGATFEGGIGKGIMAGAGYYDQRRQEREQAARAEREFGLKERQIGQEDTRISNQDRQFNQSDRTSRYGVDTNAGVAIRGQDVSERGSIRANSTDRRGQDITANTARRGQDIGLTASREGNATTTANNNADNATALGVATITSGAKNRLDPKDALSGLGRILPGMLGTTDAAGVAQALQSAPDLQATLVDAYTTAYGDGSGNAMERAQAAVQKVLGQGASYTDDNSYIPFHGSPEITRGKQEGKQVVRTGTDKATGRKVVQYSDGSISYAD